VIFGRTGVGISSLVNLIVGHPISNDHPNAKTCTQTPKSKSYPPMKLAGSDKQFCLYEVPGLCGKTSDTTILKAIREIDQKEGIDLFIYCLRKQKMTVIPGIVRHIRESIAGLDVPMIAVVTELERFEAEGGMEDWWGVPLEDGATNGTFIERMCFGGHDTFDAHACVTTLPRREVDLVEKLRKRREISEQRIRRLILEQCTGDKRPGE
jgi:predicted GTPase